MKQVKQSFCEGISLILRKISPSSPAHYSSFIIRYSLIIGLSFCSTLVFAQEFTLSGEFRPRAEYNHGVRTLASLNQRPVLFIEQRTRLNLDFKNKQLQTKLVLQDVRTWGSQAQLNKADGLASINQAWVELVLSDAWGLKLGRQQLAYDDHRILGSVEWAQQARSHDLALLKYQKKSFKAHLGAAFNAANASLTNNRYAVGNYRTMQFLWVNKTTKTLQISGLALNNGVQVADTTGKTSIRFSQTLGTRFIYTKGKLQAHGAFYYQFGKTGNLTAQSIAASNVSIELAFEASKQLTLAAGYERLSGNSQVNPDATNHAFAPLYGTNHKFNGLMDYFYVGNHANSVGLQDFFTRLKLKHRKLAGGLDAHYFMTAAPLANLDGSAASPNLGIEFDVYFKYPINEIVTLSGGYSQLFATSSMELLKGGDREAIANWAWLMLTVKPVFFKNNAE